MNTPSLSLNDVIEYFGNQSILARSLGIKPQAVQQWIARGQIPIRRAIQIERLTDGKIRLDDMLPLTGVQKSEDVAS
ncbi:MAG: Cro/CI family transcriptional regulator [Leptospirillum sp.]